MLAVGPVTHRVEPALLRQGAGEAFAAPNLDDPELLQPLHHRGLHAVDVVSVAARPVVSVAPGEHSPGLREGDDREVEARDLDDVVPFENLRGDPDSEGLGRIPGPEHVLRRGSPRPDFVALVAPSRPASPAIRLVHLVEVVDAVPLVRVLRALDDLHVLEDRPVELESAESEVHRLVRVGARLQHLEHPVVLVRLGDPPGVALALLGERRIFRMRHQRVPGQPVVRAKEVPVAKGLLVRAAVMPKGVMRGLHLDALQVDDEVLASLVATDTPHR
mmetsp:Transcript_8799/g.21665  ORF Transcript_8799/g.21665 Transcript_8799/m.21665 type:complete len:275 (+) Transcript_8799:4983-5807(+)